MTDCIHRKNFPLTMQKLGCVWGYPVKSERDQEGENAGTPRDYAHTPPPSLLAPESSNSWWGAGEGCKQDAPLAMEKEAGRSHVPHSPPLFPNLGVGEAPFLPCAPSGETRKGDC